MMAFTRSEPRGRGSDPDRGGRRNGHLVPAVHPVKEDMYAKAVQGMKPEDAVKWAEAELKKIYEA